VSKIEEYIFDEFGGDWSILDYDSQSGTPPISAYASYSNSYASSSIPNLYSMYVSIGPVSSSWWRSQADAMFQGEFITTLPLLNFYYDYSASGGSPSASGIKITVYDITTSQTLFTQNFWAGPDESSSGSGTIPISVPVGDNIRVSLTATAFGKDYANASLNYNFTLVPEPVSSILFITGGVLLVVRRGLKKYN